MDKLRLPERVNDMLVNWLPGSMQAICIKRRMHLNVKYFY
jgi:hypothetical protein